MPFSRSGLCLPSKTLSGPQEKKHAGPFLFVVDKMKPINIADSKSTRINRLDLKPLQFGKKHERMLHSVTLGDKTWITVYQVIFACQSGSIT